jgi:hypothetical protein
MHLCRIIYCSLTALRVSSDIIAHHQEHLNCSYCFWFYSRVLSAAVMADSHEAMCFHITVLMLHTVNVMRSQYLICDLSFY